MSLHTTIQYLSYRMRAKTRHGVHSPFVYAFIEQVLLNKSAVPGMAPDAVQGDKTILPARYHRLLWHLDHYCNPSAIWVLPAHNAPDFTIKKLALLDSSDIVILLHIHTTPAHTAAWTTLHNNAHVKLSIDLYGIGILFFKKEFKEKQHFILKY